MGDARDRMHMLDGRLTDVLDLHRWLDAVSTAVVVSDAAGRPYLANRQAQELLGRDADPTLEVDQIPAAYRMFLSGTDTPYPAERLPVVAALRGVESRAGDLEVRRAQGAVQLEARAKPVLGPDGRVCYVVQSFVDVTEHRDADTDLWLTEALSRAIVTAPTFEDALRTSLRQICELTGWGFGQAWLLDTPAPGEQRSPTGSGGPWPAGDRLRCAVAWYVDAPGLEAHHLACQRLRLAVGSGLPGRVWRTGQSQWRTDADAAADRAGDEAVQACPPGLRTSVAVPVLAGGDTVAVLEFFVLGRRQQDRAALDRIEAVAAQVGIWVSARRSLEALQRSEDELRALAETMTDAIICGSPDHRITYLNPAAQAMFGYSSPEAVGRSLGHLVQAPAGTTAGEEAVAGSAGTVRPSTRLAAVRQDGTTFPVEVTVTTWQRGPEACFVAVLRDASAAVQAEEELRRALQEERQAVEQLRTLDMVKDTVLQTVSHDLRDPVAAVLVLARMLRADAEGEQPLPATARSKMLADVERSARKMERLLHDLLDSDPMRGLQVRRARHDVAELVRRVLDESGLAARHPVHTSLEQVVLGIDPGQVERIVDNLLGNAAQHLEQGVPIWVKTAAAGHGVLITVEDAGPGVPEHLAEQIFQPFRRGEEPTSYGLGLGLSLVSRFSQLHGGRSWVERRPGGGASFQVYLPDDDEVVGYERAS